MRLPKGFNLWSHTLQKQYAQQRIDAIYTKAKDRELTEREGNEVEAWTDVLLYGVSV